ncbi:hypothetical protein N0V83_004375 [Neocucurbitaria cava]|uniref:Uncharacterized protein n=1 Tax=Neocucurbitaria cava TaxID=798079 RepID=A0A9W9CM47_9PLEO|nr:hypothetical protein N0V83_004375 [Neocucurbitaria cava]
MIGQAESSTAAPIFRNNDPLTIALRNGAALEMDDIARLDRVTSLAYDTLSSLGTSSTAVFSTHEGSTVTKPTSTGTPYYNHSPKGKGKARVSYASSLSVAYGSGSEAEAQRNSARGNALLAMGGWAAGGSVPAEPLKGAARAKTRHRSYRQAKAKKPDVKIIHHQSPPNASLETDDGVVDQDQVVAIAHGHGASGELFHQAVTSCIPAHSILEKKYLRRRATHHDEDPQHDEDQLRLAEEGQILSTPVTLPSRKSLSSTRVYLLAVLIAMIVLTITLSFLGAHYTGKGRIGCTKGIVFGATVLIACFTVLAMMVVRRAVQEALLAGLLEAVIGFTLLLELDDFM